ncbi:MAG: hypothetical protein WBS22_06740 [Methylocystis sp.]
MKPCLYCSQEIPDTAQKCFHCHSYQNPGLEPKKADAATLVIGFVGLMITIATIIGAVISFMGIKNYNELQTILTDSLKQYKDTVNTEIAKMDTEIARRNAEIKDIQQKLNDIIVDQQYAYYSSMMDGIPLDDKRLAEHFYQEIQNTAKTLESIETQKNAVKKNEAINIAKALTYYRESDWAAAVEGALRANDGSQMSPYPFRLLTAAYDHLRDNALAHGNKDLAQESGQKAEHYGREFYRLAMGKFHLQTFARIEQANMLMDRYDTEKDMAGLDPKKHLREAISELQKAGYEAPYLPAIEYNKACAYAKIGRFQDAITSLRSAKTKGSLGTSDEILDLEGDSCFSELFKIQKFTKDIRDLTTLDSALSP